MRRFRRGRLDLVSRSFHHGAVFVCRMYVFGGWVPAPESERIDDLGAQWICTKSLSVLHLGQFGNRLILRDASGVFLTFRPFHVA